MKKLKLNTISSFVFQVATIICGMILPRLIIKSFGSEVNGLISSISQFLGIISFLDFGVTRTVQSALYKPLADKNEQKISEIVTSAGKFFKRLAQALFVYVIILVFLYPYLIDQRFGWDYVAVLLVSMSVSSFAQYYFGVVDRILLTADQHGYIQYIAQTVTLILNVIACAVLIQCGASIQIVKLATSLVYLLRPLFLRIYVNRHYLINRKAVYESEPIEQKWDGLEQHVAMVVYESTDSIVLSVISTLNNTSIYSVYNMVVSGLKQLIISMTNGVQALLGELWAKRDQKRLLQVFDWMEWAIHTGTVFVFGCAGLLIIPFVRIYTSGISDVDYIQPVFAVLITLAGTCYCLRLPYHIMILAAGHYKQTKRCYTATAVINIMISVIFVHALGLTGVAIGTLAAVIFQMIWLAGYTVKNILHRSYRMFLKQISVDLVTALVGILLTSPFRLSAENYLAWGILACKVRGIWAVIVCITNCLFYGSYMRQLLKTVRMGVKLR